MKEIFGDKTEGRTSFQTYELPDFVCSDEETPDQLGYEIIEIIEEQTSNDPIVSIESPPSPLFELSCVEPQPPIPITPTTQENGKSGEEPLSNPRKCADKLRKFAPRTAIDQLSQLHAERQAFQEKKLKLETDKLIQNADIEEKKLNLEKEKMQKALEIEERKLQLEEEKIKNDFEIRKLQIEKDERIALREIELKYKNG